MGSGKSGAAYDQGPISAGKAIDKTLCRTRKTSVTREIVFLEDGNYFTNHADAGRALLLDNFQWRSADCLLRRG